MEKIRRSLDLTTRGVLAFAGVLAIIFCAAPVFALDENRASETDEQQMKPGEFRYASAAVAKADASTSLRTSLSGLSLSANSPKPVDEDTAKDTTGTDPRAFSSKFMPYYLYTELENGTKVNQFDLFGMYAFSSKFVVMYDWPVFKDTDYGSLALFKQTGGLGPLSDVSSGGSTTGFGDLNLRFLYKPDTWTGNYREEGKSWNLMPGIELNLPTASDDVLGTDTTTVAPMLTFVTDLPGGPPFGLGFLVLMNVYDFDVDEGSAGSDVERFRGRWFWMQPLSKPGPNLGDGLYMLTEFQPVYDFRTDDFDFWFGPEFGKIIKEGQIVYIKPGVGFDREKTDREFTLEVGYRYFF